MIFWNIFYNDLRNDINSTENFLYKTKKKECRNKYRLFYVRFILNLLISPFMYLVWYVFRKHISNKLYRNFMNLARNDHFYINFNVYTVEYQAEFHHWLDKLIMNNPTNNHKIDSDIRKCLNIIEYNLWLHGDCDDPIETGGIPVDYKSNIKSLFVRRFLFGPIRNPYGNGIHLKMRSSLIKDVIDSLDTRTNQNTSNYGTSDARVGTYLRWYIDSNNDWWYIYERVYRNKLLGWRDFYFGGVGCLSLKEGRQIESKCTRWEQSNRPCKIS